MKSIRKLAKLLVILSVSIALNGCDNVRVYGSVGYSSYNGYGGAGRGGMGSSVRVGGRIY